MSLDIYIEADGAVRAIYDDVLTELLDPADMRVCRASHVEPAAGGWTADLALMGGGVLGPFRTRAEALAAERRWLDKRLEAAP